MIKGFIVGRYYRVVDKYKSEIRNNWSDPANKLADLDKFKCLEVDGIRVLLETQNQMWAINTSSFQSSFDEVSRTWKELIE